MVALLTAPASSAVVQIASHHLGVEPSFSASCLGLHQLLNGRRGFALSGLVLSLLVSLVYLSADDVGPTQLQALLAVPESLPLEEASVHRRENVIVRPPVLLLS